ncbi:Mrx10 protein [Saccharomycopsis crataegensis]|uniref:Mrx10 protein n=1 Tax=Saccharomycopsis crataegensis TaxID=43959 RepID=A0AAV5QH34_9ASCO|nr:Mrx10 protein [Saccharomycopsis crataegensis]
MLKLVCRRSLSPVTAFPLTSRPLLRMLQIYSNRQLTTSSSQATKSIQAVKLPKASNITPITRALRRSKKKDITDYHQSLLPCTTITTCEAYDLAKVIALLHSKGYKDASFLIPQEAVHLTFPNFDNQNLASNHRHYNELGFDILILVNGSVVAWGFDENFLNNNFLSLVEKARVNPYKASESEDMDFVMVNIAQKNSHNKEALDESAAVFANDTKSAHNNSSRSGMDNDVMMINADNDNQQLLDKAAFSFGLTRSTKLAILESLFERCVEQTRQNTLDFYKGFSKKSKMKQHKETLKLIGQLLLIRGELNLYSELIDTPDLYWSEPNLESLYKKVSKNLDIVPRIEILNKKLDYATEESRIILATLNEDKASKLEWIIIYLILIEVCFELFHFYERYSLDQKVNEIEHASKEVATVD